MMMKGPSAIAACVALLVSCAAATRPQVRVGVDGTGLYSISVDGANWYTSGSTQTICVQGKQVPLTYATTTPATGSDKFGAWSGESVTYMSSAPEVKMVLTFKTYGATPYIVVGTASFPIAVNTSGCGSNSQLSTHFPQFNVSAAQAPTLDTVSWRGEVISTTAAAKGLGKLGANGLDCGPVVSMQPMSTDALVWSTLDSHKIVPQSTANGLYSMGIAAAIPELPAGFNYSVLFSGSVGGVTAAMYAWGGDIRSYHGTTRLPSVTLSDIGYYTDDGAYYYVWGGGSQLHDPELSPWIPPRPWPAEVGLQLVKEGLTAMGVPIGYMQLDDWWYQGKFYFGNVKSVTDWHASNSSGLFPHGLPAFSDKLDLPLQLYVPFWADDFQTKYQTFESTSFKGTKLVVPDDSLDFFSDWFDLGLSMTNGRFNTFEIDFLDANFKGCSLCFADVGAADKWYYGLATAALKRNISLQFCLPSATDMLASLDYPSVIQARASGDYARPEGNMNPWANVVTLGGASLLLGATDVAPSKDTLWTASPQPNTSSDRTHAGYHTQPHVQLDSILATLSLGPVGISDAVNYTDAGLIGQAFRCATDGTLLRPSRPLSTVDSVFHNKSMSSDSNPDISILAGSTAADIRATHASLPGGGPNSHYVVAWMTTVDATLQATDLYPAPSSDAALAVRQHVAAPAGVQWDGCVDGSTAVPKCVQVLPKGVMPTIHAVGGNITDYSYTAVYEPLSNGAYFIGELGKFVHASPQRFQSVMVGGTGDCGITVSLIGGNTETVKYACVDSKGIVRITSTTLNVDGTATSFI